MDWFPKQATIRMECENWVQHPPFALICIKKKNDGLPTPLMMMLLRIGSEGFCCRFWLFSCFTCVLFNCCSAAAVSAVLNEKFTGQKQKWAKSYFRHILIDVFKKQITELLELLDFFLFFRWSIMDFLKERRRRTKVFFI